MRHLSAGRVSEMAAAGLGILAAGLSLGAASLFSVGPLSHHMAQHILLMNAAAPCAAFAVIGFFPRRAAAATGLLLATVLQIVLLWAWHLPALLVVASGYPPLGVLMHGSLFAAALWFWLTVFGQRDAGRWRSILAVLVTGKLACLLGALLVFAPRALFSFPANAHGVHAGPSLDDQQVAGLMMIVACPLTYVLAGVVIAALWLDGLDKQDAQPRQRHFAEGQLE